MKYKHKLQHYIRVLHGLLLKWDFFAVWQFPKLLIFSKLLLQWNEVIHQFLQVTHTTMQFVCKTQI